MKKLVISGTGCSLGDFLYTGVSFGSPAFTRYRSRQTGDGGLSPGKLVFTEEFEQFAKTPYSVIFNDLIGNKQPDAFNVGGPSVVSLIHAAQLLDRDEFSVRFFGMAGKDETAERIFRIIRQTPLDISHYQMDSPLATPFTDVLSDPDYDGGHGERTFVNNIGAAWDCLPESLGDDFFQSDVVCFGGTGLVPRIHDQLTGLLRKSKDHGCVTVVNTVFDFRNEKKNPELAWPLVDTTADYGFIDLLIMDATEAIRISGCTSVNEAARHFSMTPVGAFIITNGAQELLAWSGGTLFGKSDIIQMPVSALVTGRLQSEPGLKGDTTGCGDNFAGGVIASLAWQLRKDRRGEFSLQDAIAWGVASGGFCCFDIGGTYLEKEPGEKLSKVQSIRDAYHNQLMQ